MSKCKKCGEMIPPVGERQKRLCNDFNAPCMFSAGGRCFLPASQFYHIRERVMDRIVLRCAYHMTLHEYAELIDSGVIL